MASILCKIDDKHVPIYRIMWVSDLPHFCGDEDCVREGQYEIRLELDESVWANRLERDEVLRRLDEWHGGDLPDHLDDPDDPIDPEMEF